MTRVSFTPIIPKKMNPRVYKTSLTRALKAEGRLHRRELKKTTRNWSDPPTFETVLVDEGKDVTSWTRPTGTKEQVENWERVNLGTRPHKIKARRVPTLRFKVGYRARTRPRRFTSGRSKRFGPTVTPVSVNHPGIEARGWTEALSQKREPKFKRRMGRAMRWAAFRTFF